jgi:hypothetical protein
VRVRLLDCSPQRADSSGRRADVVAGRGITRIAEVVNAVRRRTSGKRSDNKKDEQRSAHVNLRGSANLTVSESGRARF